jgi:hypothetical protein
MASTQINQIIGQNEQGSLIVHLQNPWFVLMFGFQKIVALCLPSNYHFVLW